MSVHAVDHPLRPGQHRAPLGGVGNHLHHRSFWPLVVVEYRVVVIPSVDLGNRLDQGIATRKGYSDNISGDTNFIQSCCPIAELHARGLDVGRVSSWSIGMDSGYESQDDKLELR